MSEEECNDAATLIATDPAFTALEASGAPIIAMRGEPLRVVYANASAKAVFGETPAPILTENPGLIGFWKRSRESAMGRRPAWNACRSLLATISAR